MPFNRRVTGAVIAMLTCFGCREEDTRATEDKDSTFVTPAGHTAHETGANEREPADRRGVPDYAETHHDAGVVDAEIAGDAGTAVR